MEWYLDSAHQLICNGIKCFSEDEFDGVSIHWYSEFTVIPTPSSGKKQVVIYVYNNNLGTLEKMLQNHISYPNQVRVVLILSGKLDGLVQLVSYGVNGFLDYDCTFAEFQSAFRKMLFNQNHYCQRIWDTILHSVEDETPQVHDYQLTNRELEVASLLLKGHSMKQISAQLELSPHTVQTHRKNIFRKLKVKSLSELIFFQLKHQLIND